MVDVGSMLSVCFSLIYVVSYSRFYHCGSSASRNTLFSKKKKKSKNANIAGKTKERHKRRRTIIFRSVTGKKIALVSSLDSRNNLSVPAYMKVTLTKYNFDKSLLFVLKTSNKQHFFIGRVIILRNVFPFKIDYYYYYYLTLSLIKKIRFSKDC